WKLAIKPGKPFAFGRLAQSVFLGLPGNPVSALVTLSQLAVPAMARLGGLQVKAPARFNAVALTPLKKRAGRTDFQRGIYEVDEKGQLVVRSTGAQGSAMLSSMSAANCFIVLERARGNVAAGEQVCIEPYSRLLD
ncbi:MAG TPA: molybdopterin molybdenumtransferase MoeA, partial [Psychromonas sp.]